MAAIFSRIARQVQPPLGGNLLPVLRNQRGLGRAGHQCKLDNLRRNRHLQIQLALHSRTKQRNIPIIDMAAILAQVNRNPIRPPKLSLNRRPNRIRLTPPPSLPQGRHMINIHTQFYHNRIVAVKTPKQEPSAAHILPGLRPCPPLTPHRHSLHRLPKHTNRMCASVPAKLSPKHRHYEQTGASPVHVGNFHDYRVWLKVRSGVVSLPSRRDQDLARAAHRDQSSRYSKSDHQLPLRRAPAPLPLHRRRHYQRAHFRPPHQLLFRPDRSAPQKGQGDAAADPRRLDRRPHRRKQNRQLHPPARQNLARRQLPRANPHHRPPSRTLEAHRPLPTPLLLPDRSPRNHHLHHRSRQKIWRHRHRKRSPQFLRRTQSRALPHCLQNGHRLRQNRRHGHDHRLANSQQARQPTRRPLRRRLPHRHPRHHHQRPPSRPPPQRSHQLL